MDIAVMDLLMAANNIAIPNPGIVTLPHIPPIHMERHNMVIHIIHTATNGKGIRSRVKLGKRGPKHQIGTGAAKAAALPIDESTGC
jgi:hypothetical protein